MTPRALGQLDTRINESSGIETSTLGDELYHINDSGDSSMVYITNKNGQDLRSVEVLDFRPMDTEDISTGPCPGQKNSCLFIADTGDNARIRSSVQIAVIEESELAGEKARPLNVLSVTYPEGRQDAESMAVHPNGDLYILTKTFGQSRVYRVARKKLLQAHAKAELVGLIDFKKLGRPFYFSLATGMDISPDGQSFLLLTYNDVIEYPVDLSRLNDKGRVLGTQGRPLGMPRLKQQEAIAYKGRDLFVYTTEGKSPLVHVGCDR